MMLKHAVILTEDLLANDTIIDEGLRAFVAIVKDLGWQYGYVGASIKKTGCWAQSSSKGLFRSRVRSVENVCPPLRQTSPRLLSLIYSTFVFNL
jgi:hypothetical protein